MSKRQTKGPKIRKNIVLSSGAITAGEKLAREDRRSLSNLIEVLVIQEASRRVQPQQEVAS